MFINIRILLLLLLLLLLLSLLPPVCRISTIIYLKQTLSVRYTQCCSCSVFTVCATCNVISHVNYHHHHHHHSCYSLCAWYLQLYTLSKPCPYVIYSVAAVLYLQLYTLSKPCPYGIIWSSTCFGRHTAHHQEPKTALAASGFAYVEGCWPCSCWTLSTWQY